MTMANANFQWFSKMYINTVECWKNYSKMYIITSEMLENKMLMVQVCTCFDNLLL